MTEITGPTGTRCQTALDSLPAQVSFAGGQLVASVRAARECTWTASSEAAWIHVSPASGQGETALTIAVDRNPTGRPRTGAVTLNDARATIAQEPAPCGYELSLTSARAPHHGGAADVGVRTLEGCAWIAVAEASWLRVLNPSGSGPGTVRLEAERNDGPERRAEAVIAGQRFSVVQEARPASPPPPAPVPSPSPSPSPPPSPPPSPSPSPSPSPPPGSPSPSPSPPGSPVPSPPAIPLPVGEFRDSGEIRDLSGSCPSIRFRLGQRTIVADDDTDFEREPCRALRNGTKVEVRGTLMSDGTVQASRIRSERKRDDDDEDDDDYDDGAEGSEGDNARGE